MRTVRRRDLAAVAVALGAVGALVLTGSPFEPEPAAAPATAGPASAAAVWPDAERATLADLPLRPLLFLDTTTVVGVSTSNDNRFLRLLLRGTDGTVRELRRLDAAANPRFQNVTAAGDDVVWTEFTDAGPPQIWAAAPAGRGPARRLTGDVGNAVFHGSEYDLVHHAGRVYWTAGAADDPATTEVRSVALTGGRVQVTREKGEWTTAPWPWLDDGASGGTGATLLRNMSTGREITVPTAGAEFAACSPSWCRVIVLDGDEPARIDLMRPDGSERRRIADGEVRAAVPDVAILDRFEILADLGPASGSTGTAGLLVHDISTGTTVELDAAANDAQSRNGLVWWFGTDGGSTRWFVLDLRTV
ncbi:hypothetical protein [Actinoplanes xinjiangensis]|uniref:Tat pathway signal sequence domain protein n=1 Tax=Actinoplanes xinjiangensis TaxID=512350 RepID=A0A316FJ07_9ACTN|nr:hypothetical protein [Actinoplanes xinjiangensis]PWK48273.1 hypothetical protein BC793_106303 [Actinoplanes xinjiangensis]GIF38972.1 hypothetical protein Axi01nite_32830 [Actinoplanes xinjiangensis]